MILKRLKTYYKKAITGSLAEISPVNLPKSAQAIFAESIGVLNDDYQRAYAKYRCRQFLVLNNSRCLCFAMNLVAAIAVFPMIVYYLTRGCCCCQIREKHDDVVMKSSLFSDVKDILPEMCSVPLFVQSKQYGKGMLSGKSLKIVLKSLSQHPLKPYYQFMIINCLADYTRILKNNCPKRIYTFADEKHFAKPLATLLCEESGVEHIGFMHGETFYQIDKGFFHYTKYYVWDDHYTKLYKELRCKSNFIAYKPERLFKITYPILGEYPIYLTYYEAGNDEKSLKLLAEVFYDLENKGLKCLFRTHPRSSKTDFVKRYFRPEQVQNPQSISVQDSMTQSCFIASLYSTVLMEAYYGGKTVVVDDLTDQDLFQTLKEKEYIIYSKHHKKLSELL